MTDLGPLNYSLRISVTCDSLGLFLSQKKYAIEILDGAHMDNCNPSRTPIDTESKLGSDGDPVSNPTLYLILTDLVAYSDGDWAGSPTTRRSTLCYCVFLGNNLLSWSSKHQSMLSHSSAEAEYHGVANAVAETCWLRNLLCELHTPLSSTTLVYCDNVSVVYLLCNSVQHQRTKHIEIDMHFVRDLVVVGQVRVLHVPSRYQFADIFIKGLPLALFEEFPSSLSVYCSLTPTAGEC
ncbi:ribonuclease H-like domain-containing protein [Tanacetum coccineum]